MDELERLFEIAKNNYTQLGGRLSEDRRRLKEDRENKRLVSAPSTQSRPHISILLHFVPYQGSPKRNPT